MLSKAGSSWEVHGQNRHRAVLCDWLFCVVCDLAERVHSFKGLEEGSPCPFIPSPSVDKARVPWILVEGKSWPISDIGGQAVKEQFLWDDIYWLHSVSGLAWGLVWVPLYAHVGWREREVIGWLDRTGISERRGGPSPESHRADDLWYLERARWQAYRTSLRWVVLKSQIFWRSLASHASE